MDTSDLTALPESFSAGTTVTYSKTFADYPASEWTLTLYLAGAKVLAIEAVADEDTLDVTIPASATELSAGFAAGVYRWEERVTKDDEVYVVATGSVTIKDNLAEATDGSLQSYLERAVVALRAHVEGRLTAGMQSYSIAGRAVSKIPVSEAVDLLGKFEARLARLRHPDRISRPGVISFVKPGTNQ